ncbi:non-ribosomal peptide synthetase [Streptomyces sp. NPDC021969]|uniref:non-ribosomal peptide synthetase family protein n=1 Tax=unclassified Streptomyces TaxID=2593676 RepID=UPI0033F7EFA8
MTTTVTDGHDPARAVLNRGNFTTAPRWTNAPRPGTARHDTPVPDDVTAALKARGRELGVPLTAILLAAHAKVLAVLSGAPTVRSGYRAQAGGAPRPWELTMAPGTWRGLVSSAHRAQQRALAPRPAAPAAPGPEVVFDPVGPELPGLEEGTVLAVATGKQHGRRLLRLRYRTDVLDADCAARIGGYHLGALRQIAADPDAPHDRCGLPTAEEIRFQVDALAGPRRPLPDRRFHELFQERVRLHPDTVAVIHRDRRLTYRELDLRSNRLAHALLARGLAPEDVVAVATERDLNWPVAVLGVLKAGGAYLPLDPHHPPGRMTTVLARAGCALVLTEPGSTEQLDLALAALPGTRALLVPDLAETVGDGTGTGTGPGVAVPADGLAYVFFTSGSTGEPKGAMCEHAGLLNHLLAKIEDLDIGEGTVVAQTASQCFDISLWQLLAALLTGGRTLLVDQEAVLDAGRFLDTIAEGRVDVLQVVPSYLDVLLTALERRPRDLPRLRCVSVTGEALRPELVRRWFDGGPGVRLVNAYGLTETSDDTNHEVLDRAPEDDRITLGRPVRNVRVYVVDDHLVPVPLGAPGALVFSGVCVGRGYVNDLERTRLAYPGDPYRPGQRLYLSGDFGRWLPDGKLEFLGRQDAQAKIRGFRVEIGEVENALLRVPGVHDGAVVVTGTEGRDRQLTAFCTGGRDLAAEDVPARLGELLPEYMIPASCHRLDRLPLTANGKTDRNALVALAGTLGAVAEAPSPPRTPTERRLAAAWAAVLGTPAEQIGRGADFFALGGTSLTAVRLAVRLDRAVSPRDLTTHPVLADLARLIDTRTGPDPGVLRPVLIPDRAARTALICFPGPGTGPIADDLGQRADAVRRARRPAADGLAVHVAAVPDAARVAAEADRLPTQHILLWGDGSGAAAARETARTLRQRRTAARTEQIHARSFEEAADIALRAAAPPAAP